MHVQLSSYVWTGNIKWFKKHNTEESCLQTYCNGDHDILLHMHTVHLSVTHVPLRRVCCFHSRRMLGSLASIIPDRKNAHHSIRQSLDSHDNVEVEAAIYAAASFSAQSK